MLSPRQATLAAIALGAFAADASAQCVPGAAACPINVQMARGADTVTLRGTLTRTADCCAYAFRARAGQVMSWQVTGPAIRTSIAAPNGEADGPGLPADIPMLQDGIYVFSVRPNLMADGAFGPFTLTVTIR